MVNKFGYDLNCEMVPLTENNMCLTKNFSCGNAAIDYYLLSIILDDFRAKTYLFTDKIQTDCLDM